MKEVIADANYYYDADGNVTTDESKGERWLAREGAGVLPEHQEALKAFQGNDSKVAQAEDEDQADEAKSEKPAANKSRKPAGNKGVK